MFIKPNLLWMKLFCKFWTPLFPSLIAVCFRLLTIMYLSFRHLAFISMYIVTVFQTFNNLILVCKTKLPEFLISLQFYILPKKINWEQGKIKKHSCFKIAVGETALFAVLSKRLWQGERGRCESESIGAHVCHYAGLPVCWFTLSLPIAKIPYYKTLRYNHKLFFFKSTEKCRQAARDKCSFCCRILKHCGNFGTHALQVIHSMCTVSQWDSLTLITIQKTLISFELH